MIQETGSAMYTGILRFYSLGDVRKYLKELLERYQRDFDRSSNVIGSLLRTEGGKGMEVIMSKGWAKVGSMFVNVSDPEKGGMEVTFQLVTEMKPRISKTFTQKRGATWMACWFLPLSFHLFQIPFLNSFPAFSPPQPSGSRLSLSCAVNLTFISP